MSTSTHQSGDAAAAPKPQATPLASCCAPSTQATCCEPSEKSSCCGSEATASGGCGCGAAGDAAA